MTNLHKSASEVTTLWRYTNLFIIIIIIIITKIWKFGEMMQNMSLGCTRH